ncbi:uncharacterized protein ACNLHF_005282 isoform 1-T1 [Anomaloglossus baeobatrachus]|uniref:uncharacterized protein LOC142277929 n=1 Tax=Anomaloglossus baeobatrachus TaxID=238106 RepID=UPI003F50396D
MSFTTLSFNEEETSSILSKVTTSGTFLTIPAEETRSRDYEKVYRKLTAFELHSITLAEYFKTKRIPRGLRVPLRSTLFSDNPTFCNKFEGILNKCSLDIIILTIDYLQQEITDTTNQIRSIEEQLTNTLPTAEWNNIKTRTQETITEFRKTLQDRKRSKFIRDQEDYLRDRVYKWRFSDSYDKRQTYQSSYQSSTSSDSDQSHSRGASFLGPRRPPKEKRGGGRGNPGTSHKITTRSQAP